MSRLVQCRAVRAVVLLLAFGVGSIAGVPTMSLPPRPGIVRSGPGGPDGDGPGGGGGGPSGPTPPRTGPGGQARTVADPADGVLAGTH